MQDNDIRKLSDVTLLHAIRDLASKEREITLQVLHHLREVERRRLFAARGYGSLFEYAVKELSYSEGSAQRRISSMRLLKELPELNEKIESGALSLSVLSQAQSFFRQEASSVGQKRELLVQLEGKSTRETERELAKRATHPERLMPEKVRPVSETHSQVSFVTNERLLEEIRELQALLAHSHPGMSIEQAIGFAVNQTVSRLRPKIPRTVAKAEVVGSPPAPAVEVELGIQRERASDAKARPLRTSTRYVPTELKRQVWQRDEGHCTYQDPLTGRRCESRYALEYDHVKPFALGGETALTNLRLRCRVHNQLAAVQAFGENSLSRYVPGLR